MKIIIPMAGMGTRMRPHTLSTPKPLLPLAGKAIVAHLIEELSLSASEKIEEIAFIIGHFGVQAERELCACAEKIGAKASIYYQDEALGTAHAILCAKPSLDGNVIVAFADTLFFTDFKIKNSQQAVIWTHRVDDPSAFGVVLTDEKGQITGFKEKPQTFVSNQAIIGIYYFKDGKNLANELQYLLDHDVRKGKEYQLTDALQNMMEKGIQFYTADVNKWLDCGNKTATVEAHRILMENKKSCESLAKTAQCMNAKIIQPCYIGENVRIENSTVGPYVSLGDDSVVEGSSIENTIVQINAHLKNTHLKDSMLGKYCKVEGGNLNVSISDYSEVKA